MPILVWARVIVYLVQLGICIVLPDNPQSVNHICTETSVNLIAAGKR